VLLFQSFFLFDFRISFTTCWNKAVGRCSQKCLKTQLSYIKNVGNSNSKTRVHFIVFDNTLSLTDIVLRLQTWFYIFLFDTISGLRMRSGRKKLKSKKISDKFKPAAFLETNYLNTDMCKFASSQKEKSRAHSADSSKVCSKPRAFNWIESLTQLCPADMPYWAKNYARKLEISFAPRCQWTSASTQYMTGRH